MFCKNCGKKINEDDKFCVHCGEILNSEYKDAEYYNPNDDTSSKRDAKDIQKQDDFYHQLRKKFTKWAGSKEGKKSKWTGYLLLAPDIFHLLCKLALDPAVPVAEKAKVGAVLAYFMSPLDFIPEAILGPIGYVDDLAIASFVLNSIITSTSSEVVLKHWAGDEDLLQKISEILRKAEQMVGSTVWRKLKGMFKSSK